MPWTAERHPASMKNVLPVVREKAIVIANALLEAGYTSAGAHVVKGRAVKLTEGMQGAEQLMNSAGRRSNCDDDVPAG